MFLNKRKSKVANIYLPKIDGKCTTPNRTNGIIPFHTQQILKQENKISKDLDIERYPFLEYIISIFLFLFTCYEIASVVGISWGLPEFQKKQWWHYILIFISFSFSMAILFNSDCQRLIILRKRNLIIHSTSKIFCLFSTIKQKKISEISRINIIITGAPKKVSLHTRWYCTQVSFSDFSSFLCLCCISQYNAERYRQLVLNVLGRDKQNLDQIV